MIREMALLARIVDRVSGGVLAGVAAVRTRDE
jgi:hypothetical protein